MGGVHVHELYNFAHTMYVYRVCTCIHAFFMYNYVYMYVQYTAILTCFMQETNVLGFKGPRKMTVIIPALSHTRERRAVTPRRVSVI